MMFTKKDLRNCLLIIGGGVLLPVVGLGLIVGYHVVRSYFDDDYELSKAG